MCLSGSKQAHTHTHKDKYMRTKHILSRKDIDLPCVSFVYLTLLLLLAVSCCYFTCTHKLPTPLCGDSQFLLSDDVGCHFIQIHFRFHLLPHFVGLFLENALVPHSHAVGIPLEATKQAQCKYAKKECRKDVRLQLEFTRARERERERE